MSNKYKDKLTISSFSMALLNPKGIIAAKERDLIFWALGLMLVVAIPVFIMLFSFAYRYRAGNTRAKYRPNWESNTKIQFVIWGILISLIAILAVINWTSTHELDPFRPLSSNVKPITIQVVALQWKWLFIYPEQNIATVNFVEFPAATPVNFQLTADAPMNSFWIPELGGQMYAMAGMSTQLHLMADGPGEYNGSAAEINGRGFAGMKFIAKSTSQTDFDQWVQSVKSSTNVLTMDGYNKLSLASENNPSAFYSSVEGGLYNSVIMKFMTPGMSDNSMPMTEEGMQ